MATSSSLVRYSLAATIFALGMVGSSALISKFLVRIKHEKEISVKGFAQTDITSDRGTLGITLNVRKPSRAETYEVLQEHIEKTLEMVRADAPADLIIEKGNPSISERFKVNEKGRRTYEIESYGGSQSLRVASRDVQWIKKVGTRLNELLGQGYEIGVGSASFLVADLTDIKQDLLEQATADGYRRAQLMASHSGASVGTLRSARQGIFQITHRGSTKTSSYGVYDTSTIEKSIRAVVTLEYSVE